MKTKLLIVTYIKLTQGKIKFKKENTGIDKILEEVCTFHNIIEKEIMSKSRKRAIADVRAIFFAFCYDYTQYSLSEIADRLNMNHVSVLYGKEKTIFILKKEYRRFIIYMQNSGFIIEKSNKIFYNPENIYRNERKKNY